MHGGVERLNARVLARRNGVEGATTPRRELGAMQERSIDGPPPRARAWESE